MKEMFSQRDLAVFAEREIPREEVDAQVERLHAGGRKIRAIRACVLGDGVSKLDENEVENFSHKFQESLKLRGVCSQFIPASGAASRMFKSLLSKLTSEHQTILESQWRQFPFAAQMEQKWPGKISEINEIVEAILDEETGLGLSSKPKGCVPFHAYEGEEVRTAFEEHAIEWRACSEGKGGLVFTIQNQFRAEIEVLLAHAQVQVVLEEQHASTDTIAWDLEAGALLRDEAGDLVWRPGGHGALLKNLGDVDAGLVFVRNIDNVVDEAGMTLRRRWQQALGGLALTMKDERDEVLAALRREDDGAVEAARAFLRDLVVFDQEPDMLQAWIQAVDRPIRVAGMVPNVGQPGGGPFWIADEDGHLRPGIAEKAELADGLMESGTHFNPVELACIMVDAFGSRYDLNEFADHSAFFTGEKTHGAKPIRILERPGLWNGGMAGWLTRFVEIPTETFAPVKTVFDLLDRRPRRRL